jgi:hypothetical protein
MRRAKDKEREKKYKDINETDMLYEHLVVLLIMTGFDRLLNSIKHNKKNKTEDDLMINILQILHSKHL